MKKKKSLKLKKNVSLICLVMIFLISFILLQFTKSEIIDNVTELRVDFNSELKYTITVDYDGKDRNGKVSSNGNIVSITSDYIYVEDILPDDLIFERFGVSGDLNTVVGAVPRDGSNNICRGYVENDSTSIDDKNSNHGLHYDPETRKVSFKIKNLQAGCRINVVVITRTPSTIDGLRKDFYNTATAWEGSQMAYSNTVHAYIQKAKVDPKKVTYQLIKNPNDGTEVPTNAKVPSEQEYAVDTIVSLVSEPKIEGYTFSGWKPVSPIDLDIKNGKFTMPDSDVVLQGYFTENSKYKVSYKIADDSPTPSGYVLPATKEYYESSTVKLDSLKEGDIFNGYKFLGWSIEGVEISEDNYFQMPAKDVEVVGRWELVKYKVEYRFYDSVLPYDWESYLPSEEWYKPGESVTTATVDDSNASGYKFLGWYKENNFTMPEEDVIIYGEWRYFYGYFDLSITKDIYEKKEYYKKGDIVKYRITIQNDTYDDVTDVQVQEHNNIAKFVEGADYIVRTDHVVLIPSIKSGDSVIVNAEYEVTDEVGYVDNTVEIMSANFYSGYELDPSKEYKASEQFKIYSELKIRKNVISNEDDDKVFQFHITSEKGYDTWLNLTGNEEKTLYVSPDDTYRIMEVVPQEYTLENVAGIEVNNGTLYVEFEKNYFVEFTNKHKKKGFYHSYGNVKNEIQDCSGDCETLYQIVEKDEASMQTTMDGTENTAKIYYYDNNNKNNVLFADKCWRIVRTTETDGVKLMYNGKPSGTGECINSSAYIYGDYYDDYGNNNYVYSGLNPYFDKLIFSDVYMYNENNLYEEKRNQYSSYVWNYLFDYAWYSSSTKGENLYGSGIRYDEENQEYILENYELDNWWDSSSKLVGRYTCFGKKTTCEQARYVVGGSQSSMYYLTLSNGETMENKKLVLSGGYELVDNKYRLNTPTITVNIEDWLDDYSKYNGLYLCSDFTSLSCDTLFNIEYVSNRGFRYNEKHNLIFGKSIFWDGQKYTLQDTTRVSKFSEDANKIANYQFTCFSSENYCTNVYHVHQVLNNSNIYYIELKNGEILKNALDKMLGADDDSNNVNIRNINGNLNPNYINSKDSDVKKVVDEWYQKNIYNKYDSYLEDTVYCNDRSIVDYGGWNPNNGSYDTSLTFGTLGINNLTCPRRIDSFTVSDEIGNGDLTYPIGLLTAQEANLIGYSTREGKILYTTMSPQPYSEGFIIANYSIENSGVQPFATPTYYFQYGVHPVISLNSNTVACMGDGTPDNPYVINMNKVEVGVE